MSVVANLKLSFMASWLSGSSSPIFYKQREKKEVEGREQMKGDFSSGLVLTIGAVFSAMLLVAAVQGAAVSKKTTKPSLILDLTANTFDDWVEITEEPLLVLFYTPNCNGCLPLEEIMLKVQQQAKQLNLSLGLARVDKLKEEKLAMRFKVRDPPHLVFRTQQSKKDLGKWYYYPKEKTAKNVLWFITKTSRSYVPTKLKSVAALEQFIDTNHVHNVIDNPFSEKPVLVGFFERSKRSIELLRFKTLIDDLKEETDSLMHPASHAPGLFFVPNHKGSTEPPSIVVRGHTITTPSLVIFKRHGHVSIYHPPPPSTATPDQEENIDEVVATPRSEDNDEQPQEESEPELTNDIFVSEPEEDQQLHQNQQKEQQEEQQQEQHNNKKQKDKALAKEEKKKKRQEEWKRLQRATSWKLTSMLEWVRNATMPVVSEVGHWNFNYLLSQKKPFYIAWVDMRPTTREEAGEGRYWGDTAEALATLAETYHDRFTFGVAGGDRYPGIAGAFGAPSGVGYVIVDQDEVKYLPQTTLEESKEEEIEFIRKHIEAYLAGNLSPLIRTEDTPAPEDNEDNPMVLLKKITHDNFKKIVMDPTKDVLVEYYITGCTDCEKSEIILENVARKLSNDRSVVIAQMELEKNDMPRDSKVKVAAWPSLFFYPAGNKKDPLSYTGSGGASEILKFIEKNRDTASTGTNTLLKKLKEDL